MNKQQLEEVRDNKPEGATHYNRRGGSDYYYKLVKLINRDAFEIWSNSCQDWDRIDFIAQDVSKISDIRTQLTLIEENEKLKAQNERMRELFNQYDKADTLTPEFQLDVKILLKELSND